MLQCRLCFIPVFIVERMGPMIPAPLLLWHRVCRQNPDQPNAAQSPGRLGCDYTILIACLLFQRAGLELYRCRCACEQIDFVVCISNSDLLKDEVIKKKRERPDREAAFHVYLISVLVSCASNFMLCKREKNNSEGHRLTGILKLLK